MEGEIVQNYYLFRGHVKKYLGTGISEEWMKVGKSPFGLVYKHAGQLPQCAQCVLEHRILCLIVVFRGQVFDLGLRQA